MDTRRNRLFIAILLLASSRLGAQAVSYGGVGDPAAAPGDPASSYALSGLDHVNYYTGQVNLTIPIHSIGGRGTVADNIVIPIERQWEVENVSGSFVPTTGGWPIVSGRYTSGYLTFATVSGNANECVTYDANGNPIGYSQLGRFSATSYGTEWTERKRFCAI